MTEQTAKSVVKAEIAAVVIRADGSKEDRGVISYWHRNPLRRLVWRLKHGK